MLSCIRVSIFLNLGPGRRRPSLHQGSSARAMHADTARAGGRARTRTRAPALTHTRTLRHESVPAGQDLSYVWPLRVSVFHFRLSSSSQTHAAPQSGPDNSRRQSVATDPPPRRGMGRGSLFWFSLSTRSAQPSHFPSRAATRRLGWEEMVYGV